MSERVKCLVFEAQFRGLHPTAARVPDLLNGGEIIEEMQYLHIWNQAVLDFYCKYR